MAYEREVAAAVEAVVQASQLCASVQDRLIRGQTLTKGDKSPVTVADFGAQAVVGKMLHAAFAEIPMVGEEDATTLRDPANRVLHDHVVDLVRALEPETHAAEVLDAIDRGIYGGGRTGRHWVLDPIDGTKGFLRLEQYAVALALIEDGHVVLGVLGCPNLPGPDGERGGVFVGVRGRGAWWRPLSEDRRRPLRVTDTRDPARARFTESVEAAHTDQDESAQVARALGIGLAPVRMDSQAKYATVARGEADVYLRLPTRKDYVERVWDHAAGYAVITEAGGTVTDVDGKALDFGHGRGLEGNRGVIATNGHLHERVLAEVRAVLR